MVKFKIPDQVMNLVKRIKKAGGRSFLVGGCVRDLVRGETPKDFDIEVYFLEVEKLKSVLEEFGEINAVGESFTVFKIGSHIDVSIPRKDKKVARGHRGFEVTGDPYLDIKEASSRRDFTVNAIMYDPISEEIVDPHGGVQDITKKILRVVSKKHFGEDSLRVLRGAQFASRLDFEIEKESLNFCRAVPLDDLAVERIWGELEKLWLHSKRPSVGWSLLFDMLVVEKLFSELEVLTIEEKKKFFNLMDHIAKSNHDLSRAKLLTLFVASLFAFKKISLEPKHWQNLHELRKKLKGKDWDSIDALMDKMGVHSVEGFDLRDHVKKIILTKDLFAQAPPIQSEWFIPGVKRLANFVECDLLRRFLDAYYEVGILQDEEQKNRLQMHEEFEKSIRIFNLEQSGPELLVIGRDLLKLGLKPSKKVGELLEYLYELQLSNVFQTKEEALLHASKWLEKNQDS